MQSLPPVKIKLPYLIERQSKHYKVKYDAKDGNRPGRAARGNTSSRLAIPLLPVVTDWHTLKSVHTNKGCATDDSDNNQTPGYPTTGHAREDAEVEK